jgi:NAD-dependent SIR2 family protein deacetylase
MVGNMDGLRDVFLLGAGASKDAGGPLNVDFLNDKYLDEQLKIKNVLSKENLKRFERIRRIAKQIFPYTNDIESLLNGSSSALFLGLMQEGELEKLWDIHTALEKEIEWYILQIIYLSLKPDMNNHDIIKRHHRFYNRLEKGDCVITLNYDLIPDHSLITKKGGLDYGLDPTQLNFSLEPFNCSSGIPLYKLHGSMNWLICSNIACGKISIFYDKVAQYAEDPDSNRYWHCNSCGQALHRVIVPPRWDKEKLYSHALNNIWHSASSSLLKANNLYVIGYSLPESDIYVKYLVTSAMHYNPQLKLCLIEPTDKIHKRYKYILSETKIDPNRFIPFRMKFIEYLNGF